MEMVGMSSEMYRYWAKATPDVSSYHLLPYHSLDVAAVGSEYLRHDTLITDRIAGLTGIPASDVPGLLAFFFALHDLGKFSESFQTKIPDLFFLLQKRQGRLSVPLRHDTIGKMMWDMHVSRYFYGKKLFPECDKRELIQLTVRLNPLFNAIFGHHGVPPKAEIIETADVFTDSDIQASQEFVSESVTLFLKDKDVLLALSQKEKRSSVCALSWTIAGLAVLADWIASDPRLFPYNPEEMPLQHYWMEIAVPRANRALQHTRILPPRVSPNRGIGYLFPDFRTGRYSPSHLQQYASTYRAGPGPHLFIIEESTGSGKTEAALTLAHQMMADNLGHGLYFALPTMATSNAMFDRIRKIKDNFFEAESRPSIILAHSAHQLVDSYLDKANSRDSLSSMDESSEEVSNWLADNRKKALLASLGVGTIDQALVAVLPRRHQSLRFFGIWRNILIVDEVHAYDPYVNELLKSLIHDHARIGGSTVLLSATLPKVTRNSFIRAFCEGIGLSSPEGGSDQYPLITHISPYTFEEQPIQPRAGTNREIHMDFFEDGEKVITALCKRLESGQCACWICNTVKDALDTYRILKKYVKNENIMLFHARFVLGNRLEREKEVIRHFGRDSTKEVRSGKILVATQVVEQSLDLDFDYLVSDLAPIDLMIQRAGRLHRHPRGDRGYPVLGIHAPPFEENPAEDWFSRKFPRGAHVYPRHGDLWLTLKILREKGQIELPCESRALIEGVFGKSAQDGVPQNLTMRDKMYDTQHRMVGKALTNVIKFSEGYQDTGNQWSDEEIIPTRLAEPTVTLRLGIIDEKEKMIRPFFNAGEYSWDMSQVAVHQYMIGGGIGYVKDISPLIEPACRSMRDKGRNALLIPLVQHSEDYWENTFTRDDGKRLIVSYSKEEGLILHVS